MARHCDGYTCSEYAIVIVVGEKIYQNGTKYCKTCECYLDLEGYRCPCCKSNVRTKSHVKQWRNKISRVLLPQNGSN